MTAPTPRQIADVIAVAEVASIATEHILTQMRETYLNPSAYPSGKDYEGPTPLVNLARSAQHASRYASALAAALTELAAPQGVTL